MHYWKEKNGFYLVASARIESLKIFSDLKVVRSDLSGLDLVGLEYQNPFFPDRTHPVLHGSHVTTDSGTGLVHTAPAHGKDDYFIGVEHELNLNCHVDEKGC